jgi:polar amino acid transport system substrate-binding protein
MLDRPNEEPPMSGRVGAPAALLLTALLAAAGAPAAAQAAAKQLNFNSNEWPPYFTDDRGLARDLLQTCLPAAGYTPRFSAVSVEQMFPAIQSGVLDGHVMSRTAERERYIEFGHELLFRDSYHPVVRRGSGIRVGSLRDLDKLRLGHLSGVRYSPEYLEYVHRRREAGTLVEVGSNEEILALLLDGKVDVFVSLASSTRWLASRSNARDKIEVLPLDIKTSDYYLGLSKTSRRVTTDRTQVLAAFDACVAGLKKDGRYQRMLETYALADAPRQ